VRKIIPFTLENQLQLDYTILYSNTNNCSHTNQEGKLMKVLTNKEIRETDLLGKGVTICIGGIIWVGTGSS
jgi:hypothetical protein